MCWKVAFTLTFLNITALYQNDKKQVVAVKASRQDLEYIALAFNECIYFGLLQEPRQDETWKGIYVNMSEGFNRPHLEYCAA